MISHLTYLFFFFCSHIFDVELHILFGLRKLWVHIQSESSTEKAIP